MPTQEETERYYELAERVDFVLQMAHSPAPMSPSAIARKANMTTSEALEVLPRMERERFVWGEGIGGWRKYVAWSRRS